MIFGQTPPPLFLLYIKRLGCFELLFSNGSLLSLSISLRNKLHVTTDNNNSCTAASEPTPAQQFSRIALKSSSPMEDLS